MAALLLHAATPVHLSHLRTEYRVDPQGVDVTAPRLSWELAVSNPAAHGIRQTAYRIVAASSLANLNRNGGDLWDTGRVDSPQSNQIVYKGAPLASGAAVYWKVQVWDQDGHSTDWSAPAQWSMGLMNAADWTGKWIGRDERADFVDAGSPYVALRDARWIWDAPNAQAGAPAGDRFFREPFEIPAGRTIARATCIAGSDGNADIYINGRLAAKRSGAALPFVTDISALVHSGANLLAIDAPHATAGRPAGAIAVIRIEFTSGDPLVVASSNQSRVASKVEEGWQSAGYLDTAWQPATELGAYGIAPWNAAGSTGEHRLPARMLRKEFSVGKTVRRATVYYAGLGLSELYLNGAKVGDHVLSPGLTDYDKRVLYETFDVTGRLAAGRNAIGLMLGNGRYYAPRIQSNTRNFAFPKAILQLNIEYDDGTRASIVSDDSWKLTTAGPIRANNEYDGEEFDARMTLAGWDRAGFNDASWEPVQLVAAPQGMLASQMAEPLRVTETIRPIGVKQLRPGVWIFDMGQNMVGWCRLHVEGPRGATVQLRHAETLQPDGSLYVDNLRTARATDRYTLAGGGAETWEPRFTYHGFRFVELSGYPGTPTIATLEGRVVHDDMEQTVDFTSSNPLLNQIHHNMFWGIRGNYRSIPTDCPQRDERQGWLGDRSQVSRSESYMFDVAAFYSKFETDIADGQRADGSISDVSPNYWRLYNDDLSWPSTFVFLPGMLYDQYGDRRVLEREYPAMRKWLDHERTFVANGLMPKDTYADWCVPPEDPLLIHSKDPARVTSGEFIGSAYFYQLLRTVARYARILDKETDAAELEREASAINNAFQLKYWKSLEGVYDNGTQTTSILPLYFGMAPEQNRAAVLAALVRNIEVVSRNHVGTGLVGAQWLMRTLTDNGQASLAYSIATQKTYPGWGYMAERGATTVWELWNGDTADPSMNSGNHVMQIGDLAVWMYEYLAGIRSDPADPGFHHAIIHPYPTGDLTSVKASHKTMYGTLASAWKREGGKLTLDVTVPPNTTATVWVPGTHAEAPKGARFVRTDSGAAVYDVPSGRYRFTAAAK